jgi:hypothetical protein
MPDLLGNELEPYEERMLEGYRALKALCEEPLPPVAAANLRAALVHYYQAVNSLALVHEQLADLEAR